MCDLNGVTVPLTTRLNMKVLCPWKRRFVPIGRTSELNNSKPNSFVPEIFYLNGSICSILLENELNGRRLQ